MQLGQIDGEYIQVTGEFEKRDAIEFCVQDLHTKGIDFGVCEQDGKYFVARAIVPDEEIGLRGAKALDLQRFPVDFAYTIDCCELPFRRMVSRESVP